MSEPVEAVVMVDGRRVGRAAVYETQIRAKYDTDQLKALQAKGHTFPGGTSYPIDDKDDLEKAIHAVGRGGADHDAIRKYIIGRAAALKLSNLIPDGWSASGSIEAKSGDPRNAPTVEDWGIGNALKESKMQVAATKARQLADPDYGTDPDDDAVMGHIEEADDALDKAIMAQSKDGHEDARQRNYPTAKRAFTSLVECSPSQTVDVEVRMEQPDDGDPNIAHFRGYPSPTGIAYHVRDWLGEYNETMEPGCYGKTLREQTDIPTLFNHGKEHGVPLASTASGTKRLSEDGKGLREESVFDRRDALTNSVVVQLERGVLKKMSISFRGVKDLWNETYDKRQVTEAQLYDTSIVTYPANPTAQGELVEAMRSAMGREGRSLWLADSELSVRSALPIIVEHRELPDETDDLLERAVRALVHADEVVCRSYGQHGRARTFLVANAMLQVRAGKALSAKNEGLLRGALDALSAADKAHSKAAMAHEKARGAVSDVLAGSAQAATEDGKGQGTPPGNGNPIMPQDGAGPRSLPPSVIAARRQVEALRRGRAA